ncbi:hypothetical protein [Azospirillum halopraeferens]|uniref:hypothetical protein n=1 Tax=Azospirillum halopraeferens TaxID=34010 RepID=UPI0004061C98|nr:hypothetical protein [Azospirillum halopraeferens]
MTDLIHDPFIQSSALPLLLSLLAVGLIHTVRPGGALPAAGIGATYLAVHALVVGVPALPPPSGMGKLFWAAVAGVALGALIDAAGWRGRAGGAAVATWLAASLVWIAWPVLDSAAAAVGLAVLLAAGMGVVFGTGGAPADSPVASAAVPLALGLAVGGTALFGSSASIAQTGLALAAAAGGFLLWNWPVGRHGAGASLRIAAGIAVLLAGMLTFFTGADAAVLLLALPALLAGRLHRHLPFDRTAAGRAAAGAVLTVAAVLPALAAVAAAYALGGGSSPY